MKLENTKKNKISVIIPVYNGEKTLKQCLTSIIKQDYIDYEIIIVDNNSIDNTKEIINNYMINNKNIRYIFEEKKGRGAARNAGINNSTGEIIAMTDSDCIVPSNWVSEITKPIREDGEKIVMGLEENILENYWSKNIQEEQEKFFRSHVGGNYIDFIDTKNFAIRSELIKKYMFDSNLKNLEDFDLAFRIKKTEKIRLLQNVKVKHLHKNSFISWSKLQIERGFWSFKIYTKYKIEDINIKKEKTMTSTSLINTIKFPFWLIKQFFINPINKIPFIFVSEISWRIGLFLSFLK